MSFSADRCTELSSTRQLTDEEFDRILEEIRKELTNKLAFLNERVKDISLSRKLFNLSLVFFSPSYYRFQRHLIDWGIRSEHPHLDDLALTKRIDKEGLRYYDSLCTIPGDKPRLIIPIIIRSRR